MDLPNYGEVKECIVIARAISANEVAALMDRNIDVLGFLPIQIESDAIRVPRQDDMQST